MSRRKRIVMTGLNQPYFTSKSWAICYHRQHCGSSSKKRRELLGRTTNMVCHNPLPCQTKWFLSGVGWKYNTLTLHHSHIKCRFLPSLLLVCTGWLHVNSFSSLRVYWNHFSWDLPWPHIPVLDISTPVPTPKSILLCIILLAVSFLLFVHPQNGLLGES